MTITENGIAGEAAEALHQALLAFVTEHGDTTVAALLAHVASTRMTDLELVASAMWDLVEDGKLDYGTNAHVRPATAA